MQVLLSFDQSSNQVMFAPAGTPAPLVAALSQAFHSALDVRLAGLERLKSDYEERAYWQLKAVLDQKSK